MKKEGITLIELVVVMAIIAIGAALIAPNIGAWIPSYRLRSASRDVVSALREAQMKAISTKIPYQVSFNPAAGSYILQYQDTGGNWINEGASQKFPSGIVIRGITFPGDKANFSPNYTASTGNITLENTRGSSKTVTLTSSTGRVRIQ
jgi:prepilin-type N-terminal cleavage/methylation domain-containing protein